MATRLACQTKPQCMRLIVRVQFSAHLEWQQVAGMRHSPGPFTEAVAATREKISLCLPWTRRRHCQTSSGYVLYTTRTCVPSRPAPRLGLLWYTPGSLACSRMDAHCIQDGKCTFDREA